jgi:hypothetical protein
MEFLTRTWRDLRRILAPDAWFTLSILAVVLTLEVVGRRQASNDVLDAVMMLMLAGVVWVVVKRHQVAPLGWVTALGAFAERFRLYLQARYAIEIGIDLRGTPPLPRGIPRTIFVVLGLLFAEVVILVIFAEAAPLGFRSIAVRITYLGYLSALAVLWLTLVGAICMTFLIPVAMIHDAFVTRSAGKQYRSRRLEGVAVVGYFGIFFVAAVYLPHWTPLAVCAVALLVNLLTIAIPSNPDVKFIWRYRNDDPTVRAIPWGQWVTCEFSFLTLAVVDLVLLSAGSTVFGYTQLDGPSGVAGPQDIMPITTSLGLTVGWLACGALTALVIQTVLGRTRDPARHSRPLLRLQGHCSLFQRKALQRLFAARGWCVRWSKRKSDGTDVAVELVAQPVPAAAENPSWPLRLTTEELRSEAIWERLQRRHEIQMRRRLVGGLERLFKLAAARTFRRGSGLWIAPHLWFIPGLTRDTQEEDLDLERGTILSGIIGAPYHRIFPRAVRHHLYLILRALQVDLIFVEDGVGFRRFCRVLRMMFEIYDVYGGRRRADELHFTGVPGVRVMIHEYQLDEPFRSEVYPEPDYENLGRARILHIFKDRGEQDEPLETPQDFTNMPMPSAAL